VTGDIHATKSLDRERKTHYVLHAQALDRNTEEALEPKSEFIIKVQDINDNAPTFPDGPFVATVPEMSEVGKFCYEVNWTFKLLLSTVSSSLRLNSLKDEKKTVWTWGFTCSFLDFLPFYNLIYACGEKKKFHGKTFDFIPCIRYEKTHNQTPQQRRWY